MKFATNEMTGDANGVACLALVKTLLNIMEKKDLISEDEIDIILNCAVVEVNQADDFQQVVEAKDIIENMLLENDHRVPTSPRGFLS